VPRHGEGIHKWLFCAARYLHALRQPEEIEELLSAITDGCDRPVPRREIADAVRNSQPCAWVPGGGQHGQPPRAEPAWPAFNEEEWREITRTCGGLVDLWEASPVCPNGFDDPEVVVDLLFPAGCLLCCGFTKEQFATATRAQWRGHLCTRPHLVPNPMSARRGRTQNGHMSAHSLANTGPRRFLVVEQDRGTLDEQAAVILHWAACAPLVLVVHSGRRSLHAWFYCAGQPEEKLRGCMEWFVRLGADSAGWGKSQFTRMPGARRSDTGVQQAVYFIAPHKIKGT
jgi:hypothetical protein